jgi:type II secretory ATPase GspE/PulE/Tfp pilus assembly ATPase PilB-like protein
MRPSTHQPSPVVADKVRNLEFSDLYLGHPKLEDRFSDVSGAGIHPLPAGPALREDLGRLTEACLTAQAGMQGANEFKVEYDSVSYRVSTMPAQGGSVFVVSRIVSTLSSLSELGIPQAYIRRMMLPKLSGLFIVSGTVKSGKTRTACAMLKDRLTAHGGIAVTGENPVELPLEGHHGSGICFQTVLPRQPGGTADALRNMMRWRADTILIDEIRDQESAAELLMASSSGHLVITTMLADDVVQTVTKLHALAIEGLGPGITRALLGDALLGVLHQQMMRGAKHVPKPETQFLFLKDAPTTRSILRKAEFELLGAEISKQAAAMITENASAMRMASLDDGKRRCGP